MQFLHNDGRAVCLCAAFLLMTGCGGAGATSAVPLGATTQSQAHQVSGKSWMLPEAKSENLLYAPGGCGGTCVLSYPDLKLVGSLPSNGNGACSDSRGNILLPFGTTVTEYAHGGSEPIATLNLPGSLAEGCSVDPKSNNLAVRFEGSSGDIAIFANETGYAQQYDSHLNSNFCGSDDTENLFVDGMNGNNYGLAELPKGASQFIQFPLPPSVGMPGQVQWDGNYITYESSDQTNLVSRLAVSGSTVTVVGTTKFNVRHRSYASWIYDGNLIIPYDARGIYANVIGVWKYPQGGNPTKTVRKFPPYKNRNIHFVAVTLSVQP